MIHREPEEDDSAPWKEQENWEGDQIRRALKKGGPKDRKPPAEQYEYVFENQIDFITDAAARGKLVCYCQQSVQSPQRFCDACQAQYASTKHAWVCFDKACFTSL